MVIFAGIAQLARASAFQAEGCEFESHYPLHFFLSLSFEKLKLYKGLKPSVDIYKNNIFFAE